jgi:hypothetical protein
MPAAFDSNVSVTVEAGFGSGPLTASPTWTDISADGRGANWNRGRNSVVGDFPAGAGNLRLNNLDGDYYPWNTSSPYSPNVKMGVPIRVRATHNMVTYDLVRGYVRSWANPSPIDEEIVTVPFVETYARLASNRIQTSMAAARTDVRIGAILDAAGWPAGWRNLDVGIASVAAIEPDASAVFLLRDTTTAEQGQIFQDASGDVRFVARGATSVTPAAVFGPSGSDLTYTNVNVDFDDDFLFNKALVTGSIGDQQSASDATSITDHGPVNFPSINSDAIVGEPEALNVAEWIVANHKTVEPRITGFTIDPAGDPANLWPVALSLDLRDIVTVKVEYPGSSVVLSQDVAIEHIAHSFTAGGVWTVTYSCHPLSDLEQESFWILGTSKLGTETILA